ncbi:DUF1475 family protein [Amphiplicatus metriothermophilus]|uniref:DUF1475 domain-containing protein n=1 Tax=Amphiplicatus metriothermophilus TaxID=1519374 RepID=A0A239PKQ6_9PROT|nr:DUF1475 family protein [Amphiplicatus metriothermophilus]MBB5517753.1 CBS-domain-containing membrane protein [Amphiplicatus metriothermophilus]SNT67913.1 Protein of unknown function [Amphiplicatus metriothermophilus]
MAYARLFFLALAAGLVGLIVWAMGADGRGLGPVLAAMLAEPWTIVTLADLYLGFVIAAAAIVLAERRLAVGLAWALPIFVLGNVWTALWVALRLPTLVRRLRSGP